MTMRFPTIHLASCSTNSRPPKEKPFKMLRARVYIILRCISMLVCGKEL
ncbi:hypothetical protein BVRB_1g002790 [Beta vulgaris subsp. vulgaris]|nr:hypothetical protein BVRB_1g002790 [Beta vulgaris subsp. vulgaris]